MKTNKLFPNGFESWAETHFEVASYISRMSDDGGIIDFVHNMGGTGAVYELAEAWTDEFEELNKDRDDWDGEWFDKIEAFCNLKNKPNESKD
jgi:hypothetical protein